MNTFLTFFQVLKFRNEALFYFGALCLAAACLFLLLSQFTSVTVFQVNAWYKPLKFALSTCSLVWAMAWYMHHIPHFNPKYVNWLFIALLAFEITYIAYMAAIGQKSHFNVSTTFHAVMFSLMAVAATFVTLLVAYVGFLFFITPNLTLPNHYIWSIRLGIFIFVIFAFQGFAMGAKMSHSIGADNHNSNLFILGWSNQYGDLRIAHFIGMHALQLLPLLSFYLLRSTKLTFLCAFLYLALASFTYYMALKGKPLLSANKLKQHHVFHHTTKIL